MRNPTLYIMCGLSFSGKTVLSKAISEDTGIVRIGEDDISHERGLGLSGVMLSDETWVEIHAEAERRIKRLLEQGRGVVYDTTAFTKEQRDHLRELASHAGAESRVVYMDVGKVEARRRFLENRGSKERFDVHEEDFNMVVEHFEPPLKEKDVLIYKPGDDPNEWAKRNLV